MASNKQCKGLQCGASLKSGWLTLRLFQWIFVNLKISENELKVLEIPLLSLIPPSLCRGNSDFNSEISYELLLSRPRPRTLQLQLELYQQRYFISTELPPDSGLSRVRVLTVFPFGLDVPLIRIFSNVWNDLSSMVKIQESKRSILKHPPRNNPWELNSDHKSPSDERITRTKVSIQSHQTPSSHPSHCANK